jgi:hypothetical protein
MHRESYNASLRTTLYNCLSFIPKDSPLGISGQIPRVLLDSAFEHSHKLHPPQSGCCTLAPQHSRLCADAERTWERDFGTLVRLPPLRSGQSHSGRMSLCSCRHTETPKEPNSCAFACPCRVSVLADTRSPSGEMRHLPQAPRMAMATTSGRQSQ